jgi:DnaK suppressor protein
MTQAVLSRYRDLLQTKLMELKNPRQGLEDITVVRSADGLEEAQYRLDRDLAIVSLNHESGILRGVAMGLRRIQQGTFGVCTSCGGDISWRRLDAVPWTPLCIDCQKAGEAGVLEETDRWFPDAA